MAQALHLPPIYDTKYVLAPGYTSLCASQLPVHTQHTEKKTDQKSVQKLAAVQNILLSIDSTPEPQKEEQGKTAPVPGDTSKEAIDVDRTPPPGSSRTSRQKTKAKLDDHRRKQDRERNYRKKTRELLEMETSLLQVCLAAVPPPSGALPQTSLGDPPTLPTPLLLSTSVNYPTHSLCWWMRHTGNHFHNISECTGMVVGL